MDYKKVCQQITKYLICGMTVSFVAFFIPRRQMKLEEIVIISFTAAATFAVLENYAPSLYKPSLFGTGFGIGANQSGFEGFTSNNCNSKCFRWKENENGPRAENCDFNSFF